MSAESNLVVLKLDCVRLDGGTQIRIAINDDVVGDYAALIGNQVHLPPLCVFFDGQDCIHIPALLTPCSSRINTFVLRGVRGAHLLTHVDHKVRANAGLPAGRCPLNPAR